MFKSLVSTMLLCFARADFPEDRVTMPPGNMSANGPLYAGYLESGNPPNEGKLYYMLSEGGLGNSTQDLIVWLEGGPGCSSLVGAFYENGPLLIT